MICRIMRRITYLIAITWIAGLLTLSCSESSVGNDDLGLGNATFSVSGDVEGSKSGMADFSDFNMNNLYSWDISIHDFDPQTFSLQFMIVSDSEIERPSTGTYSIGNEPDSDFTASFTDTEDGFDNSVEYSTLFGEYSGTLTITESNNDVVKGTFSFTAGEENFDPEVPNREVSVTNGEFEARPRMQ